VPISFRAWSGMHRLIQRRHRCDSRDEFLLVIARAPELGRSPFWERPEARAARPGMHSPASETHLVQGRRPRAKDRMGKGPVSAKRPGPPTSLGAKGGRDSLAGRIRTSAAALRVFRPQFCGSIATARSYAVRWLSGTRGRVSRLGQSHLRAGEACPPASIKPLRAELGNFRASARILTSCKPRFDTLSLAKSMLLQRLSSWPRFSDPSLGKRLIRCRSCGGSWSCCSSRWISYASK